MRIHLISIGGSVMHNLALALAKNHQISGSDDEIYEPALSRLKNLNLLPENIGWDADRITPGLDAVVLGMHARKDNPELLKAQELNLPIFSFPEWIYKESVQKKRVVIAGSHGKTTTTSMILFVLKNLGRDMDYLVGAKIEGFDEMVRLSEAPLLIVEGDEYPASVITMEPKFIYFKPHIAVITGIAWDHMNVFNTFESYKQQFSKLIAAVEPGGYLIYYQEDPYIVDLLVRDDINYLPYSQMPVKKNDQYWEILDTGEIAHQIQVFGEHNLQNIQAAWEVCKLLGVREDDFFREISMFTGAAKRLQLLKEKGHSKMYLDFAHAPSKAKATVAAIRSRFPQHRLIACLELHTFSSLNINFLPQYAGCFELADQAIVFFQEHTLTMKKLPALSDEQVKNCFGENDLIISHDPKNLTDLLARLTGPNTIYLMMTSGTFGGLDLASLADRVIR